MVTIGFEDLKMNIYLFTPWILEVFLYISYFTSILYSYTRKFSMEKQVVLFIISVNGLIIESYRNYILLIDK